MAEYFMIGSLPLDGDRLPEPAHGGAIFSVQDIDSAETGRNQNGEMMRDRVATKIKWQLTFPPLSRAKLSALLNSDIKKVTFKFTYPDPFSSSEMITKECYVGDRTTPMYSMSSGLPMWENVSFSIIEI
jgi:hypothetical protein